MQQAQRPVSSERGAAAFPGRPAAHHYPDLVTTYSIAKRDTQPTPSPVTDAQAFVDLPTLQPKEEHLTSDVAQATIGVSGLKQRSGLIMEEFDRNLQGDKAVKIYRQMQDNDSVVAGVEFLLRMYLQGATWEATPFATEDDEGVTAEQAKKYAADALFLEQCMDDMTSSWTQVTNDIWTMLTFGWSWLEPVYKPRNGLRGTVGDSSKYTDGKWGWRTLAHRAQESKVRWVIVDGRILGWIQQDQESADQFFLPIMKGLLFRTVTTKNNPEGKSILRTAYRSWWFKTRMEEIEAIGIERELAGLPVVYVPPEVLTDDDKTAVKAAYERLAKDIRRDEQAGVVLPAVYDAQGNQMVKLELLGSAGRRAIDVGSTIERHARHIAMSILADVILLGHEAVGSLALADQKDEMLKRALGTWLTDAADVFNRYEIPRLFKLNGDFTGELPKFVVSPPSAPKMAEIMLALKDLAASGAPLWPNPELSEWVFTQTGVPVLVDEPEDVEPIDRGTDPGTDPTLDGDPVDPEDPTDDGLDDVATD